MSLPDGLGDSLFVLVEAAASSVDAAARVLALGEQFLTLLLRRLAADRPLRFSGVQDLEFS